MMKKTGLIAIAFFLAALFYWSFLKYTGSETFVKKDIDALNLTYSYTDDEFKKVCDRMSPFSYVSGLTDALWGGVPGGRTYYYKSRCYQELAVRTLNPGLCKKVIERKSLFNDGSGVSEEGCLRDVALFKENEKKRKWESDQFKSSIEGVARIVQAETKVEKVSPDGWKASIVTEGTLFGEYEIEIRLGEMKTLLVEEKVQIRSEKESFEWIFTGDQFGEAITSSRTGKRIFNMAISLKLIKSDRGTSFGQGYLTSIGNVSIDIGER
ncbi:MAG: hypothetical protein AB1650_07255 [Candidatus Omnitrophota bacterium]